MQQVNLIAWRTKLISRLWWRALTASILILITLALTVLLLNTYRKTQIIQQQYYLKLWRQVLDYVYQQQDSADKLPPLLHEGHAKGLSPSQKRGYCYQAYFWLTLLPTLPKKIWIVSAYQSKIDSLIEGRSESLAEINEFMTNLRAAEVVKTTKLVALNRQPDSSFQFRLNIKLNTAIPSKRIALCNLNH